MSIGPDSYDLRLAFLSGRGTDHVLKARRKFIEQEAKKLADDDGERSGGGEQLPGEGSED